LKYKGYDARAKVKRGAKERVVGIKWIANLVEVKLTKAKEKSGLKGQEQECEEVDE